MGEELQGLLQEVMKLTQRNYTMLSEIHRMTKELGDALSKDDRETTQLILNMRQKEIGEVAETRGQIQAFLSAMGPKERTYVRGLLNGEQKPAPGAFEEQKISDFAGQCRRLLEQITAIDKAVSLRVAGKDSFYR